MPYYAIRTIEGRHIAEASNMEQARHIAMWLTPGVEPESIILIPVEALMPDAERRACELRDEWIAECMVDEEGYKTSVAAARELHAALELLNDKIRGLCRQGDAGPRALDELHSEAQQVADRAERLVNDLLVEEP